MTPLVEGAAEVFGGISLSNANVDERTGNPARFDNPLPFFAAKLD
jgi:hypothetical protein